MLGRNTLGRRSPSRNARCRASHPGRLPFRRRTRRGALVFSVVAYAISAVAGIAVAYWLVSWLVPGVKLPKLCSSCRLCFSIIDAAPALRAEGRKALPDEPR